MPNIPQIQIKLKNPSKNVFPNPQTKNDNQLLQRQSEFRTLLYFNDHYKDLCSVFFCFGGQQKAAFLEIYVLAKNVFDQEFIGKFE